MGEALDRGIGIAGVATEWIGERYGEACCLDVGQARCGLSEGAAGRGLGAVDARTPLRNIEVDLHDATLGPDEIDGERQRLFAEADAQAEALLADGRARLELEVADLQGRADTDIASAGGRANDELRTEVSRLSSVATERLLAGGIIDGATQQDLIEAFISKVGAS